VWAGLGAIALMIGGGVGYRMLAPIAPATIHAPAEATATPIATEGTDPPPRSPAGAAIDPQRADRLRVFQATASASATGTDVSSAPAAPPLPQLEVQASPPTATVSLRDVHVVVYTTGWCPVCKRAKAWMALQGIRYEERNIELSSEDAQTMRAINPRGSIPTFDIEGDVMVGFSEQGLVAAMQNAARWRAAGRHM
jgi:glutaredoxin